MDGSLTLDAWTVGNLSAQSDTRLYSFAAIPGKVYAVNWDDGRDGSGAYPDDIVVTACRHDVTTVYFNRVDSGYTVPQSLLALDDTQPLSSVAATGRTTSFTLRFTPAGTGPKTAYTAHIEMSAFRQDLKTPYF